MQTNPKLQRAVQVVGSLAFGAAAFVFSVIVYVQMSHVSQIDSRIKPAEYAIVLGASIKQDGTPSDALYDRIQTAVMLYGDGSVKKLLMTGDDGKFHANEVATMKNVAMELGVPESDILIDGQGYRTYESCKRAKQEFHVDQAVIVTQRFHLGRAMYLESVFRANQQTCRPINVSPISGGVISYQVLRLGGM